jgi:cell wall-associated NlpC family hydrolase
LQRARTYRKATAPVDYGEVRDDIKNGDIVLFRGKSLVSRAICWATRSPYSHAGVVGWWNAHLMVLEAVSKGVVATRLSYIVDHYPGGAELWTTDRELARVEVVREAQFLLGRSYSMMKLFGMARRMVFGAGGHDKDPERSPDAFLCSEFVSRAWRKGGLDLKDGVPDQFTRPGDIARSPHLRKIGDLFPSHEVGAARVRADARAGARGKRGVRLDRAAS